MVPDNPNQEILSTTIKQAIEDIKYLLAFIPEWAEVVPIGLDPTMYGTGSYANDRIAKESIKIIKNRYGLDDEDNN